MVATTSFSSFGTTKFSSFPFPVELLLALLALPEVLLEVTSDFWDFSIPRIEKSEVEVEEEVEPEAGATETASASTSASNTT
jgi:hypothetical protein